MDNTEKALKIKMLQDMLRKDYGITSNAELLEAIKNTVPVDISTFVLPPAGREQSA